MAEETPVVYVRLVKGATFTTPFGVRLRKGVPLRVAVDSPHLTYYRSSSRFRITETVSKPRDKASRVHARRRRRPAPAAPASKPSEGSEENDEQPLTSLTRKQLVTAAKELGITVKSSDNKADIAEMIEDHNAALLAKAEKDAAAAEASKSSTDGDPQE